MAAILIYFFSKKDENGDIVFSYWQYADPICTYLFSILVLFTTSGVAKECLKVLMEGTPTGIGTNIRRHDLSRLHGSTVIYSTSKGSA